MNATIIRRILGLSATLMLSAAFNPKAGAQEIYAGKFAQQSGEELYQGICQGCHMPDAKGATGAGTYPALANNPRLAASIYAITVVVNGQRAMPSFGRANPPFGAALSSVQIANVLNYVRTHFGNQYSDVITPAAVKAALGEPPARHADGSTDKSSVSH
jgi:mono/diheme cytochrome c family protein